MSNKGSKTVSKLKLVEVRHSNSEKSSNFEYRSSNPFDSNTFVDEDEVYSIEFSNTRSPFLESVSSKGNVSYREFRNPPPKPPKPVANRTQQSSAKRVFGGGWFSGSSDFSQLSPTSSTSSAATSPLQSNKGTVTTLMEAARANMMSIVDNIPTDTIRRTSGTNGNQIYTHVGDGPAELESPGLNYLGQGTPRDSAFGGSSGSGSASGSGSGSRASRATAAANLDSAGPLRSSVGNFPQLDSDSFGRKSSLDHSSRSSVGWGFLFGGSGGSGSRTSSGRGKQNKDRNVPPPPLPKNEGPPPALSPLPSHAVQCDSSSSSSDEDNYIVTNNNSVANANNNQRPLSPPSPSLTSSSVRTTGCEVKDSAESSVERSSKSTKKKKKKKPKPKRVVAVDSENKNAVIRHLISERGQQL
jgi:hypothetical protein